MAKKNKNVLKRIIIVKQIVDKYYEPGNQSKSKASVYRKVVRDMYPMSEVTFRRYMSTDVEKELSKIDDGQLRLDL